MTEAIEKDAEAECHIFADVGVFTNINSCIFILVGENTNKGETKALPVIAGLTRNLYFGRN